MEQANHRDRERKSVSIHACKRRSTCLKITTNLHQVVLQNVPNDAIRVEVPAAALGPEVFFEGDLNGRHAVAVPHVLEHHISEAKREHVLHHFFAQVVVNPEIRQTSKLKQTQDNFV